MNILQKINTLIYEENEVTFKDELILKIMELWADLYDSDKEEFVYDIFRDYGIIVTEDERENMSQTRLIVKNKLTILKPYDLKDIYEMMGGNMNTITKINETLDNYPMKITKEEVIELLKDENSIISYGIREKTNILKIFIIPKIKGS